MPIRAENKALYPKDWKTISLRIRKERARDRCECKGECGEEHWTNDDRCEARNGEPHPVTLSRVVLTVAHLDHQPEHCDDDNLKAMCQRCHNKMDAPMRRRGIKVRSRALQAIGDLFNDTITE